MKKNTTKRLCRTAVIAALYATLTYVFLPLAFGPIQIRPAEALCILPLLYPEAIYALTIGCALSNLSSPYLFYDLIFGTLTTFFSAFLTYLVSLFLKKDVSKLLLGGLFPILFNALVLPVFILFVSPNSGNIAYFSYVFSIFLTQSVWVYGLGSPLYYSVKRLQSKNAFLFIK